MKSVKTVYVFGAGASAMAGLPIQNLIIKKIFLLSQEDIDEATASNFMSVDVAELLVPGAYIDFCNSRKTLAKFLVVLFGSSEDKKQLNSIQNMTEKVFPEEEQGWIDLFSVIQTYSISLEDIFTIFDRAYISTDYYKGFSDTELSKSHNALKNCIIFMIALTTKNGHDNLLYKMFACHLVNKRKEARQKADPFSIISMNWDTLLDYAIHHACEENNVKQTKRKGIALIDYCCYDTNLDIGIPSTHIKVKNGYNIKLMKLHGSINWLICSSCGRLYTHHTSNIAIRNLYDSDGEAKVICSSCQTNNIRFQLRPIIITPTFIKSLNSIPIRNIWHNASLDLAEAETIVFIGYSLPDADFELRYMLKKAIRPETKIRVILHEKDSPEYYQKKCERILPSDRTLLISQLNLPEYRYNAFFPNNDMIINYDGFEKAFLSGFID